MQSSISPYFYKGEGMKIVVKNKNNKEICDINIDPIGVISLTNCTMEDIETDSTMSNVKYLEVKLVNRSQNVKAL